MLTPVTLEVTLSGAFEVNYPGVYVVKTVDDILAYHNIQLGRVQEDFKKFLQSPCPDHEHYGAEVSSMFVPSAETRGLSVLQALDNRIRDSLLCMLSMVQAGRHVVVNRLGGWFAVKPDDYIIVDDSPQYYMTNARFVADTKVIVLENDATLDPFFRESKPSALFRLRTMGVTQIESVLNTFHATGGTHVLVYTQALQIAEAKAYLKAFHQSHMGRMHIVLAVPLVDRPDFVALCKQYGASVIYEHDPSLETESA